MDPNARDYSATEKYLTNARERLRAMAALLDPGPPEITAHDRLHERM